MARPFPSGTQLPKGKLTIDEKNPGIYYANYIPPVEAFPQHMGKPEEYERTIFVVNHNTNLLTILPYRVQGSQPMRNRYFKLESISIELQWYSTNYIPTQDDVEGFLNEALPPAMAEDYRYGLGFKKIYQPIISFLE